MKPYLKESISGDKIQLTAVLALFSFIGVFAAWGYMSRGFIKSAIFGIYDWNQLKPTPTPGQFETMAGGISINDSPHQDPLQAKKTTTATQQTHDARVQVIYVEITPTPQPEPVREYRTAIMSNYWPPLGGINCDDDCSTIATGESWHGYVGQIVACPAEFEIGTVFLVEGNTYQCRDRGGAIITEPDGSIWLDILTPVSKYAYRTQIQVEVIRP